MWRSHVEQGNGASLLLAHVSAPAARLLWRAAAADPSRTPPYAALLNTQALHRVGRRTRRNVCQRRHGRDVLSDGLPGFGRRRCAGRRRRAQARLHDRAVHVIDEAQQHARAGGLRRQQPVRRARDPAHLRKPRGRHSRARRARPVGLRAAAGRPAGRAALVAFPAGRAAVLGLAGRSRLGHAARVGDDGDVGLAREARLVVARVAVSEEVGRAPGARRRPGARRVLGRELREPRDRLRRATVLTLDLMRSHLICPAPCLPAGGVKPGCSGAAPAQRRSERLYVRLLRGGRLHVTGTRVGLAQHAPSEHGSPFACTSTTGRRAVGPAARSPAAACAG